VKLSSTQSPTPSDNDDDEGFAQRAAADVPQHVVVPHGTAPDRLDKVLAELLPVSRSRIRSWIDAGAVTVNGKPARARDPVAAGDAIALTPEPAPEDSAFAPEPMALDVVFEDRAILVINKPTGLVVHPAAGHWSGTLVNGLLAFDPALRHLPRAGIVHRLDADTSGLMVVARTLAAHADLVRQLQARSVDREYWAVVLGNTAEDGIVDTPIGRDPRNPLRFRARAGSHAKDARTRYRRLAHSRAGAVNFSWLACKLDTGRTHQIRVHLESIRHPIVGDPVYRLYRPTHLMVDETADQLWSVFPRQALHAALLALDHPQTGKRTAWRCLPPRDMRDLMRSLGFKLPRTVKSAFEESE
jgi:23S rRNA pseudouridine1911/1915/1917 synthase